MIRHLLSNGSLDDDDEDREFSLTILKSISEDNKPVVPWLWFFEIGNALTMAVRRKRIVFEQVDQLRLGLFRIRNGHRPRRFNLYLGMQSHIECIEYLDSSFERDAKILVSLVTRNL